MAESAQTLIRARDETGPAWASAQQNAAAAISGIKGMIPGLASALSAAGFINMVRGSIDAMDHLNDLSKTTGLTVESLAGLKVAAKQSGGDLDSIAASVNKLAVEMGKAPEKFRELGITARDPLEALKQLADIFNSIQDPQQRAAFGAAALGKAWQGAVPFMAEGSQKMGEMIETGAKLSGMTKDLTRQADDLSDKWTLLAGTGGLTIRLIGPMLPLLNEMADAMLEVQKQSAATDVQFNPLVETLRTLIVAGSEFAFTWRQIGIAMVGVKVQMEGLASGGIKGFTEAREMMKKILDEERAGLDAFTKKIMEAGKAAGNAGLKLGSGPPGGRAEVDRVRTDDASVAKFLGTNKGALEERMALQREIDKFNAQVTALQEAQEKRSIEQRLKNMDDLRDAELANAREKIELDREIAAHNQASAAAETAQQAATIAARMQALDAGLAVFDSLRSETDLENLAYAERLTNLKTYLEFRNLSQVESNELLAQLQVEHEAKLGFVAAEGEIARRKFAQMTAKQQAQTIFGELSSITAGVAQHNRALFEINKVAGIANAIISAHEGIALTMKSYPFPLNVGMAAAHAAAAFAQVSAIQSATFGGGGGTAPSIAGSTPAPPVTPVDNGARSGGYVQTAVLEFSGGDFFSRKQMYSLAEAMIEAQEKGVRFILPR